MKGIRFNGLHTYDDLGLILSKKEIGAPSEKTAELDIPGADGVLDMTDFFGEPKYGNVKHRFEFSTAAPQSEFLSLYSTVKNALHGKKGRIILDDDPSFCYMGRCTVSSFTDEKGIGKMTIDCNCEPYRYKTAETVVTRAVAGAEVITLTNSRKRAVPEVTITTDSVLNIRYQTGQIINVWDLGSGSFTLPELELVEGNNLVTVTGTGTISFAWTEGAL